MAERGRTEKKERIRRERRMDRKDFGDFNRNLTVPDEVQTWAKNNNKVLRFCNDDGANLTKRTRQDWDFVSYQGGKVGEKDNSQNLGDAYSVVVGKTDSGSPITAYLMCKEKDWYEDDQKMKQEVVDEVDNEIKAGRIGKVEKSYQPKDGAGRALTNIRR